MRSSITRGLIEAEPIFSPKEEAHSDRAAPNPAALIEAMRSLGYTLETAVADIVDNSLSHGASNVHIQFDWAGPASTVSISDDGNGMSEKRLVEAMRAGSHDPRAERAAGDLGRFGLGLKTASFSQASRLSVMTRAKGLPEAIRVWDLPHVSKVNDWLLLREVSASASLQAEWMRSQSSGTCVVWEGVDRLVGDASADNVNAHKAFMEAADRVAIHLAMVFGEFLIGASAVKITIGNVALSRWDPFLRDHSATQVLPQEQLADGRHGISVQPYVLPHHSRLSKSEFVTAAGAKGWNSHQGFYVYRNRRLISAGGWLSLGLTRDEHLKLARIRIDLGNEVDFDWKLDVRKSVASPPIALRQELRRIARLTRERAQEVYRHRGRRIVAASPDDQSTVWEARQMRGKTLFRISRDHPLVRALTGPDESGRATEALLKLVEQTIPLASIYIRHAEAPNDQPTPFDDTKDAAFKEMLCDLYQGMRVAGHSHEQAVATLSTLSAVKTRPHLIATLHSNPPTLSELD
ncbi:ATP-binding protein [Hydrogenophaga sp.]|uniref:ATP-binding protein n=1 Tax=Hydrogenophaga sp. TaxID=1904254 RepID=UPI003F727CE2